MPLLSQCERALRFTTTNACLQVCGREQLAAVLAKWRSAGVTPEVNLKEHETCMPPPSMNKTAHSDLKPRGNVIRSPK